MTKVFVSGCYDILHAGHIEFFKAARAFGDSLTVCFASDEVYRFWKHREPSMPEEARRAILQELRCVDEVYMGIRDTPWSEARRAILQELRCVDEVDMGMRDTPWMFNPKYESAFDFRSAFHESKADVLVSTSDDKYADAKEAWCHKWGARYFMIPKPTKFNISTTAIRKKLAK